MNDRFEGVVKWFSKLKGFGFIESELITGDIFVHYSAIDGEGYRNLVEGDNVTFELVDKGKGNQAQNVRVKNG